MTPNYDSDDVFFLLDKLISQKTTVYICTAVWVPRCPFKKIATTPRMEFAHTSGTTDINRKTKDSECYFKCSSLFR